MPYAYKDKLSQTPIDAGIEITEEQYKQAIRDKIEGKLVAVKNDILQVFEEKTLSVYSIESGEEKTISVLDDVPEGFTELPMPDANHDWNGSNWELSVEKYQKELISLVESKTQARLDAFATTGGYSNNDSISKYKDITDDEIALLPADEQPLVTRFRTECRYLAVQTARTWAKLYLILDEVTAGTRPVPSGYTDIEPELPVLQWPE
jgi:hypothetical protein